MPRKVAATKTAKQTATKAKGLEARVEARAKRRAAKEKENSKHRVTKEDKVTPGDMFGKGLKVPLKIYGLDVDTVLGDIERKVGSNSVGMNKNEVRLSTGNLAHDLLLGGGLSPGWYTNRGMEQSCKTTDAMTTIGSAVSQGVPIIALFDYEGSTGSSAQYMENILRTLNIKASIDEVFGKRDSKGKYLIKPRIRYYPEAVAETFFDFVAMLERHLPDKIYEGGKWWYVYENTKANRKALADDGVEYDKTKFSTHNKFYVEAQDGSAQALIVLDSYPAMLPERLDDDSQGAGLGAVARMFSEQIPRVKGKMRKKRIIIKGINQLRERPMVRYGSPLYEPAGNAVKFYSDCRTQFEVRAISSAPEAKQYVDAKSGFKEPIEKEPSVELKNGSDEYTYIFLKSIKNKLGTGAKKGWIRLWKEDAGGNARGFDPVFDVYEYLKATGQVVGKRKKMLLKFENNEAKKPIEWLDFKRLILGDRETIKGICLKMGCKPMVLRDHCFKQMAKGRGMELFHAQNDKKVEDVDSEGDSSDDGEGESDE
jgi:hypothetical protein